MNRRDLLVSSLKLALGICAPKIPLASPHVAEASRPSLFFSLNDKGYAIFCLVKGAQNKQLGEGATDCVDYVTKKAAANPNITEVLKLTPEQILSMYENSEWGQVDMSSREQVIKSITELKNLASEILTKKQHEEKPKTPSITPPTWEVFGDDSRRWREMEEAHREFSGSGFYFGR